MAGKLVPRSQRDEWEQEYSGPLWRWMLEVTIAGIPDSQAALTDHVRKAWMAALRARFCLQFFGAPGFALSSAAALLAILLIGSGGLRTLRQFARGLPFHEPARVVILAQGPPYFGIRLGFRDRETVAMRMKGHTLKDLATYSWSTTVFNSPQGHREIIAAEVGPSFFDVLGVGPVLGHGLTYRDAGGEPSRDDTGTFLASEAFWRNELHSDLTAIGRQYDIGGRSLRLAGILPRGFIFLSTPIAVWLAAPPELPAQGQPWPLALRGAVGRLLPGVTPAQAEADLRDALVSKGIGRRNFLMHATPVADLVYRPLLTYGSDFLIALGGVLLWAAIQSIRDHRRGADWRVVTRFWGFFAAKTAIPLAVLFVLVFEFTDVTRLGVTGGTRPGQSALGVWLYYSVLAMIMFWAWRDQPKRCRVCLQRMHHPIRIGIPGQMLLETAGQEVICPDGHGSVFRSDSVMGAEISDRWMGFP